MIYRMGTYSQRLVSEIITTGLVCWLDSRDASSYSGSGTVWSDLSGNSNDATLVGGIAQDGASKSLIFDGSNDYITTSISSALFSGGDASISVWLKLDSASPTRFLTGLMGYSNISTSVNARDHYPFTNGLIYLDTFRTARVNSITPSSTVSRDSYHLITITTESGGSWKFYQNDELIATTTAQATVSFSRQFFGKSANPNSSVDEFYFKGKASAIYVYDKALSLSEITNNYNVNN